MQTLIIGCGYLGRRVAAAWKSEQHQVAALTRNQQHADELSCAGIDPIIGDVTDLQSLTKLPAADVLLYSVGFDRSSGKTQQTVYVDGLRNVLQTIGHRIGQMIYVSSTSVYGQQQGEWIDEESPTIPTTASGEICLEAEQIIRSRFQSNSTTDNSHAVILRLAGIYGPGRLLRRIEAIKAQTPITGNPLAWLNLIHVDDATTAVLAAAASPTKSSTYVVCDNAPLTRKEYYQQLSQQIGASPPEFDTTAESSSRVPGLGKRCRNSKMIAELNVSLKYRSIAEGLPQAVSNTEQTR